MSRITEDLNAAFLTHRQQILRFLTARLGDAGEAEEALQDVWLKLGSAAPRQPIADMAAYLYRMAENVARDRRRSDARRRARESNWAAASHGPAERPESAPSPERLAIERDRLRQVERALDGLPERTRYIFAAYRVEGRAQKDIAAELGVSVSAVEKHLQRAYKAVIAVRADDDAESGRW